MAHLHPFKAWRPDPKRVKEIASVPYDVITFDEVQTIAENNSHNFLHVSRPEVDLPDNTDPHDDAVYEKGAKNLQQLLSGGVLQQEEQPSIYIYQLIREGRTQTGVFACVSVEDYDNEVILKHELTRPTKEDDRTRHILTQQAHAEPVMLTYKDDEKTQELIDQVVTREEPLYDYVALDEVRHKLWKVENTEPFEKAFRNIPKLYIADGHHRCKSASRAAAKMKEKNENHTGEEEYNFFPAVAFPMSDMHIMAYNRIVHEIPDHFLNELEQKFDLLVDADPVPSEKGEISIYIDNRWFGMTLPIADEPNSVEKLDVHRLQEFLLDPMLGISDPRRNENISFVGGIRGTEELERLVENGNAQMAVSMYPTGIEELIEVSDNGFLMPPKSTWFEPKLQSGLLVHTF